MTINAQHITKTFAALIIIGLFNTNAMMKHRPAPIITSNLEAEITAREQEERFTIEQQETTERTKKFKILLTYTSLPEALIENDLIKATRENPKYDDNNTRLFEIPSTGTLEFIFIGYCKNTNDLPTKQITEHIKQIISQISSLTIGKERKINCTDGTFYECTLFKGSFYAIQMATN